MDAMYDIVTNSYYGEEYTKEERSLAAKLIKDIIDEEF